MVTIRPIAGKSVEGTGGSMSCQLKPVPDEFTGGPENHKINQWGVCMDFGAATPTDVEDSHYSSWYA